MTALPHRTAWVLSIGALALAGNAAAADKVVTKSRQCEKAERRVANEEQSIAKGSAAIEHDRKERASCATRAICERYDARIKEMETRKARHESRLAKFKTEAARACSTS